MWQSTISSDLTAKATHKLSATFQKSLKPSSASTLGKWPDITMQFQNLRLWSGGNDNSDKINASEVESYWLPLQPVTDSNNREPQTRGCAWLSPCLWKKMTDRFVQILSAFIIIYFNLHSFYCHALVECHQSIIWGWFTHTCTFKQIHFSWQHFNWNCGTFCYFPSLATGKMYLSWPHCYHLCAP